MFNNNEAIAPLPLKHDTGHFDLKFSREADIIVDNLTKPNVENIKFDDLLADIMDKIDKKADLDYVSGEIIRQFNLGITSHDLLRNNIVNHIEKVNSDQIPMTFH